MTQANRQDPRPLNVISDEEFNRLKRQAEGEAWRQELARMTPAERMNVHLSEVAKKYGPKI